MSESVGTKMYSLLNSLDSSNLSSPSKIRDIQDYISAPQFSTDIAVSEISGNSCLI